MAVQISPSILSADFARLADETAAVAAVADWLHVDVMDYHFVPNLTLGLPVVESLLKHATLPLDCHLMIEDPDRWAPEYATAGARNVTIHAEAVHAPVRTLRAIRAAGARAGLAVNPGTPVEPYEDLLPEIDMLLLMTVEPGFGGQHFLDMVLPKLRRARELVGRHGAAVWLQVDGGVSEETIERCADAGADVFVAGSAVFNSDDPADVVQSLRAQAERATAHAAWAAHNNFGPPGLSSLFYAERTGLPRSAPPRWSAVAVACGSVRPARALCSLREEAWLRMSSRAHSAPGEHQVGRGDFDSVTRHAVSATVRIPMGTLTRKMPRQLQPVVITPPSTGPSAVDTPVIAPHTPNATPRSGPRKL
jgi:ribulose-phosphate 3-epimerase